MLRILLPAIICVIIISACGNNSADSDKDDLVMEDTTINQGPDSLLVWEVDNDSSTITKYSGIEPDFISLEKVINGLNQKYPQVPIILIGQGNDTAYTRVTDSEYLGQRIGSAGASAWIADAVINLTSVPGVNFVRIDMEKRSHASGGTWGRTDFAKFREKPAPVEQP